MLETVNREADEAVTKMSVPHNAMTPRAENVDSPSAYVTEFSTANRWLVDYFSSREYMNRKRHTSNVSVRLQNGERSRDVFGMQFRVLAAESETYDPGTFRRLSWTNKTRHMLIVAHPRESYFWGV